MDAADRIRVNVVLPGTVETPMLTDGWSKLRPDRTVDEMNIGWLDFYYISEKEYEDIKKQKEARSGSVASVNPQ